MLLQILLLPPRAFRPMLPAMKTMPGLAKFKGSLIRPGDAAYEEARRIWNDATLPRLARSIYQERAFDRLPILADALEDAGCDNADILNHLRGPGPHARGCWLVDLLLEQT